MEITHGIINERDIAAKMILNKVGECFVTQPEETGHHIEQAGTHFAVHGNLDDAGEFDVLVCELNPLDGDEPLYAICLLREEEGTNALLYSRFEDDDHQLSEAALLVRAAIEQLLGVSDEDGELLGAVE